MDNRKIDIDGLVKKWEKVLNEGDTSIENKKVRRLTAIMLENQANHMMEAGLLNEANYTGYTVGTNYPTSGQLHKIAIPMVRRTFPEFVAHDLVGVQPMTGPVGLAFALRFRA